MHAQYHAAVVRQGALFISSVLHTVLDVLCAFGDCVAGFSNVTTRAFCGLTGGQGKQYNTKRCETGHDTLRFFVIGFYVDDIAQPVQGSSAVRGGPLPVWTGGFVVVSTL